MRTLTRRTFLAAALGGAAGAGAARRTVPAEPPGSPPDLPAAGYRFLRPAEVRFVAAACDCLIPPDRAGGGALAAGVPAYLDAQLAGAWGNGRRACRSGAWQPGTPAPVDAAAAAAGLTPAESFRAGLAAILADLDRRLLDFAAAPRAAQTRYLRRLQAGAITAAAGSPADCFDLLLMLTVEGFFSHPRLGATRDRVAWRLRGFPGACAHRG